MIYSTYSYTIFLNTLISATCNLWSSISFNTKDSASYVSIGTIIPVYTPAFLRFCSNLCSQTPDSSVLQLLSLLPQFLSLTRITFVRKTNRGSNESSRGSEESGLGLVSETAVVLKSQTLHCVYRLKGKLLI